MCVQVCEQVADWAMDAAPEQQGARDPAQGVQALQLTQAEARYTHEVVPAGRQRRATRPWV